MSIFLGLSEIANQISIYANGFHALGHETFTVIWEKNRYYPTSYYDVVIQGDRRVQTPPLSLIQKLGYRFQAAGQLVPSLLKCDVFIFFFGSSFLPGFLDYPLLKRMGKKIVSVFCGDDIFYWDAYAQEMQMLGLAEEIAPLIEYYKSAYRNVLFQRLKNVRTAERHADLILSLPSMGQLQMRPYMRFKIPLEVAAYTCSIPEREVPIILHAPSNRDIKGTSYILAAVEELRREGLRFDFRLIENTPNAQVRTLLAEADIVIDQLFSQTIAMFAVEAMATGNAVLSNYLPDFTHIPADCPVIKTSHMTMRDNLREAIVNRDMRRAKAQAGRLYVEKYHDHIDICREILGWLSPEGIQTYEFYPRFYHERYRISPQRLAEERVARLKKPLQVAKHLLSKR